MGTPKAALEWHGSTLLRRAAGIAARAVDGPVVVVRAPGQALAPLPAQIELADDAREGRGPFEAIAAGLQAIGDRAQVVYVTAVDAPFLHPALIARVLALLGAQDDVAIPVTGGFAQPLAAAYRIATVAPQLRALLDNDDDGAEPPGNRALLARLRVAEIGESALLADPAVAAHDPQLQSLRNLNDPGDYAAARARPAPAVTVSLDGGVPRAVHAATLRGAAGRRFQTATINGRPAADPDEPLVEGDRVALGASTA
jgi:molybdopterin-guanine dinucleotide biosynthesis protein A